MSHSFGSIRFSTLQAWMRGSSQGWLSATEATNPDGESTLARLHARVDRVFTRTMYAQWIVAIAVAAWYAPDIHAWQTSPAGLLTWSFVCGGIATCSTVLALRLCTNRRLLWFLLAASQVGMIELMYQLLGSHSQMLLHVIGSLALMSLYADGIALLGGSLLLVMTQGMRYIGWSDSLLNFKQSTHRHWLRDIFWLVAFNALLGWIGRERRSEMVRLDEQQRTQRDLLHRAFHDSGTGLPNRAAVDAKLDEGLEAGAPLTCLCIDIDSFRSANELLGHRGGDALMRSIVARIQDCAHDGDLIGRIGGDRFLIVVNRPHTRAQISALAESIVQTVSEPHTILDRTMTTSVTIGIASFPADATDRESLLAMADRAMLSMKSETRNSYRFVDEIARPCDERNNLLSSRLQRALLEESLQLVYQPIFTINEKMVAVEALARWRDPVEGNISPGEFVPIAEATGLIVPLSNWVLREACEQMVRWSRLSTTLERIAVNVSVKQVWRSDFVATVERTLLETGLPPSRLELEVTEGALATDFETVKKNLQALRKLGVRISIDDFGTGYSSLSRVRELDADVLKVDRIFVQGASETPNGVAVVQAIIDMAHHLRLSVIAEGVETQEQFVMLRNMNCDEIQGFLLARPQAPEVLTAALRNAAASPNVRGEHKLKLIQRTA